MIFQGRLHQILIVEVIYFLKTICLSRYWLLIVGSYCNFCYIFRVTVPHENACFYLFVCLFVYFILFIFCLLACKSLNMG